jgi:hypothetical protein
MFDDAGSEFALSEFYFQVLQLLRIACEWIKESMDDLKDLVDTLESNYMNPHLNVSFLPGSPQADKAVTEAFKQCWKSVMSHQQRHSEALLRRIAKKQEEVEGLRDGVSYF